LVIWLGLKHLEHICRLLEMVDLLLDLRLDLVGEILER
jgi:hypothetical protein